MNVECKDLERVLREQEPAEMAALAAHGKECAACRAELEECADLVGAQLGWDTARRETELREVRERIPFRRA